MNAAVSFLINLLYPDRCYVCGEVIPWRSGLCPSCRENALYVLPPVCDHCGRGEEYCTCEKRARAFTRCVMPFYYDGPLRRGIPAFKKTGGRPYVEGLSREMAEVIRREYGGVRFDFVTAVPLYPADERRRGHNPAALLARSLARQLLLPWRSVLIKITPTLPQKELPAARRAGNLLGVFEVAGDVAGKTVLLVDDVITTGSTLEECAKMLQLYGAAEVYAVTAACTVLKKSENGI